MARSALTPQNAPWGTSAAITWTTLTSAGMSLVNEPGLVVLVYLESNTGASVIFRSADDPQGRSEDVTVAPPSSSSKVEIVGPLDGEGFHADSNTGGANLWRRILIDASTTIAGPCKLAALRRHF